MCWSNRIILKWSFNRIELAGALWFVRIYLTNRAALLSGTKYRLANHNIELESYTHTINVIRSDI